MALLGTLLRNKRVGQARLAWNAAALAGPETLELSSADFTDGGEVPAVHAHRLGGGTNTSPALAWADAPAATAQFLLVMEDADSPTSAPFVHCLALIAPEVTEVPAGALGAERPGDGVQVLRAGWGRGYQGPAPLKGHGPHRYVFQVFALSAGLTSAEGGARLASAKPRAVLAAVGGPVLARGRMDGWFTR
ncbi:hypothetical protein SAMN05216223_106394 [Actinacidiphila yanglinensis]|uniref:YbhB/YbcL family Raf kinase inhibitor-like protein n=1 Tax=Actinacidiphila yanglinensis TaxID=310779 RepID=A0A1H6BBS8_9ACTN|nr:YbhB/YbcL family Raf kinase inhibitor-like protein [Actinacidiphila yanglinensis]SEG58110.1 hypothetical protein SAMN05216223_106394 [Actinacidiphila yanglinensis]